MQVVDRGWEREKVGGELLAISFFQIETKMDERSLVGLWTYRAVYAITLRRSRLSSKRRLTQKCSQPLAIITEYN